MADDLLAPHLKPAPVRWRQLLLPSEHGSWAFAFEPVLLGLLVAFSPAALCVTLAVALGFIARKPAKYAFSSAAGAAALRPVARRVLPVLLLGSAAALASAVAASRWQILIPLLAALPGAVVFARQEQAGQVRSLAAELVATALCSLPLLSIALAAGKPLPDALALGAVSLGRAWPSLLFVRARLRTARGGRGHHASAIVAQILAPLALAALAHRQLLPPGIVPINLALSLRAGFFLLSPVPRLTAKQLGIAEVAWGLFYTLACAAAYAR